MLQLIDGSIREIPHFTVTSGSTSGSTGGPPSCGTFTIPGAFGDDYATTVTTPYVSSTFWMSYPIYVCTDKTAKAIEILKKLQADKVIDVKSVNRFIQLVEDIAAIL